MTQGVGHGGVLLGWEQELRTFRLLDCGMGRQGTRERQWGRRNLSYNQQGSGGEDGREALTTSDEPDAKAHRPLEARRGERLMSQERTY